MQPIHFFFGFLVGLCVAVIFMLTGVDFITSSLKDHIIYTVILLIGLSTGGFVTFFTLRNFIIKKFKLPNKLDAPEISDKFYDLISNPASFEREQWREECKKVFKSVIIWYVSITGYYTLISSIVALVAIFAGMAASLLIFKQNELIHSQTQTNLVETLLAESNRRAVNAPIVRKLISDITEEGQKTYNPSTKLSKLSEDLVRRIIQVSIILKPYIIAETKQAKVDLNDKVSENLELLKLSPERGIILQALMLSRVDMSMEIYQKIDFSYADMRGFRFSSEKDNNKHVSCNDLERNKLYHMGINAPFSDFSNATLNGVNFPISSKMIISSADFDKSYIRFDFTTKSDNHSEINVTNSKIFFGYPFEPSHVEIKIDPKIYDSNNVCLEGFSNSKIEISYNYSYRTSIKAFYEKSIDLWADTGEIDLNTNIPQKKSFDEFKKNIELMKMGSRVIVKFKQ